MAENRVPYIIDLTVSDKDLRTKMSKLNWEDILGTSKGKSFKQVLKTDTEDAAKEIRTTLGGLGLDWGKILGEKELKRLETVVGKVITANKDKLQALYRDGDTSGIERTIDFVAALGNELKALGSSFDVSGIARNINSFMKVLTPISAKIEQLANEPAKVEAAFDRLFSDTAKKAQSVDIGKAFDVSGKIKIAMQGLKATNEELAEAAENIEKYQNIVAKLSGNNPATIKLAKDLDGLNKQMDEQMRREEQLAAQGKTNNAQYAATLKNIMAIENARLKMKAKPTQNYAGELISQDFGYYEEKINKVIERASQKIEELEGKLASTVDKSFAEVISKQISDIKVSISLSDDAKKKFVNEINAFVKNINDSPIEKVRVGVEKILDDSSSIIEDKSTRAYKDNPADDDASTTKIVEQTEKRFDRIATAIQGKQNKILSDTKTWRNNMLEQFKFKSGDFEFKFNDTLIEELQSLFDDYALKVNIDPQYLADQIKTVLNSSDGSLGGGTASIDANSMASAIAMGLRTALTGEMPQVVMNSGDSNVDANIPQQVDYVATEIEQTGKHLDLAEDYVKDVVEKLKAVAKYAAKDSKGSIATRNRFNSLGIDLHKVKNASDVGNDAEIVSIIENSLLQKDEFGKLKGSTIIDELSKFKDSSSKTIPAFLTSMNEVFFMLQENTQTVEEWTRRRHDKEIFDSARGKAQAASGLRDVRSSIRQGNIPNIESIENVISLMTAIGKNTDDLEILKSAREVLGDKTDDASIEEFKTAADTFYKSSTKTFWDLKKQAEDTFKGTVYFQGKTGKTYSKYMDSYKQIANIKDDAVIVDVQVSSSLNNVALGTTKSKHSNRISSAEEQRLIRDAAQPDFIVPREYEEDVLYKELKYKGFNAQGITTTQVDLDASLEANQKRKQALITEIATKEEERKSLDAEISILDKRIEELTEKNKTIPQKRRDSAKEKVSDYEATQQQLSHEIFMEEQKIGGLTKNIEEQLSKRASAEEQLAQLSELDVERKKKELDIKISELETEAPKLQEDLTKARARYNIAESDRVMAQVDVNKASVALKAIPNTKKNEAARTEAENTLNQARFALANATERVNEASKNVDSATKAIEVHEKKILNLQNQMSETTLESIREEQLSRIRAIDDVITSLENEFETLMAQKNAKEATLTKINKELEKSRNVVALRTERELDLAISERDKLNKQKTVADSTIKSDEGAIESLEQTNKRIEAEKEYNKLLEKSLMLQGSINKMEEDGEPEKKIERKRKQLEKVNGELTEAEGKVRALGGFLGQQETKEYSDNERKTYALEQLELIENDLITAKAQKRIVGSRIAKKDKDLADLDKWGLGAGIGASELGRTKGKLTSDFMSSDYVKSLEDALRAKVKETITESENKSRKIFDQKVTTAMEHLGWNPLDQTQVKKFLNTQHGQQLSSDFASEVEFNKKYLWEQYEHYISDLHTKLRTEFKESLKVDNGVLSATFKTQDETGQWIDEIVEVRVKEVVKARLEAEKKILEAQQQPIQSNIDRLEADKAIAIEYGGVTNKELLSGDIIEDQIRKEEKLSQLKVKRAEVQQKLNDLENAGVDHSDDSYKSTKKDLNSFDKEIARYEMLIKNRQKLVQMRYDESKEPTYTDEEKELHFTNQIVSYNEKIESSLAKQKTLKEQIASATGDDKTKLERQLSIEEENVARWRSKIPTYENKLNRLQTSKVQGVTSGVLPEGGLIGGIVSAVREAVGGVNIDINTEELAKEITLKAILDLLSGVTQTPNNTDYESKMARIAELEAKANTNSGKKKSKTSSKSTTSDAEALYTTWNVKSSELEFDSVKKRAIELKQVMDVLYDEGKADTIEFINAQTELSKLLSGWRSKVSKTTNPEVYGKESGKDNWMTYLTSGDTKLFDNLDNVLLSSVSKRNYLSKLKKVGGTTQQSTSEPDDSVKSNLTKKERAELKQLRAEVENYSSTSNGKMNLILSTSGLATENTLREILNSLNENQGGVNTSNTSKNPSDKKSGEASDTTADSVVAKANQYAAIIKNAQTDKYLMDDDPNVAKFGEIKNAIDSINQSVKDGTPLTDELKTKLEELGRNAIDTGERVKKTINQNKRLYTGINEINAVNRQRDKIIGTFGEDNLNDNDIALVQQYNTAYKNLHTTYDNFAKNRTLYDTKNQEQLRQQAAGVQALGKKLMASITQASRLNDLVEQSGTYTDKKGVEHDLGDVKQGLTEQEVKSLEATMRNYVQNTLGQANIENVKFNNTTRQLIYTFRTSKSTVADMVVQYNAATNALYAYQKQERESLTGLSGFMQSMRGKLKSILQYAASITSIYRVWGVIKQGIQYVREIDSALTELKKVTDETEESYDRFLNTAAKTADKVGSTIKEIVSSTADWARLNI